MVGGWLYASNGIGLVEALDRETTEAGIIGTAGTRRTSSLLEAAIAGGVLAPGRQRGILTFRNHYLYALDARTGKPVAGFGLEGRVDLAAATGGSRAYTWNGAPLVVRDVVVLGSSMASRIPPRE